MLYPKSFLNDQRFYQLLKQNTIPWQFFQDTSLGRVDLVYDRHHKTRKTSPNFFRVYKKSNGKFIRFELEMKLETAKNFQFFLFAGQFETLESKLIQHYYSYITIKFEIHRSCYTDWIVENFRNVRVLQIPKNSLVTTYLINNRLLELSLKTMLLG